METTEFAGLHLRRGGPGDVAALEKLQASAYQRNAVLIGVVPVPLQWNYRAIVAACEVWLLDGTDGPQGALIVSAREADFYIESISVAPAAQGMGRGGVLLGFAEVRARHHYRHILRLMTNERLVHNIDWYKRQGFAIEYVEKLADRNAVHMVKHLQGK